MPAPQDTRMERERRWFIDPAKALSLPIKPFFKTLHDRYLSCGRLRLREQIDSDTGCCTLKLTKKYPASSPYEQALVTILLTEEEHRALSALSGYNLTKTRHYFDHQGETFALDTFSGPLEGLLLSEIESTSLEALLAIEAPPHALAEVTEKPFFSGWSLCQLTADQLTAGLLAFFH